MRNEEEEEEEVEGIDDEKIGTKRSQDEGMFYFIKLFAFSSKTINEYFKFVVVDAGAQSKYLLLSIFKLFMCFLQPFLLLI